MFRWSYAVLNLELASNIIRLEKSGTMSLDQLDRLSKLPLNINISCLLCVQMRTEQPGLYIIAFQFPCSTHRAVMEIEKTISV